MRRYFNGENSQIWANPQKFMVLKISFILYTGKPQMFMSAKVSEIFQPVNLHTLLL